MKRLFSIFGFSVHRLSSANGQCAPAKCVVSSPLHHNSKEGLNEFYSDRKTVESYLDFEFYDRVLNLLGTDYDGKRIADAGCGIGHLLRSIHERYQPASLTGYDFSEAGLEIARTVVPAATFHSFDIYQGTNQTFDVVFCVEVLEHLLYPHKALKNIVKMIAPGGAAVLTVPNGRTDTFEGHINFWSPESWEVFLKGGCEGFKLVTGSMDDGQMNYGIITDPIEITHEIK
jgi:2-polyprenyl-3-methyl-5-hydroxy-6-metoxy-1,4-benzoquinol methylase